MNCARVERLLDEYRDGDLQGPRRAKCDAHLRTCARCSDILRQCEKVAGVLRGWEQAKASDDLTARVVAAWEVAWPKARRVAHRRRLAARLAVGVGTTAVVGMMGFASLRAVSAASKAIKRPPAPSADEVYGPLEGLPVLEISDSGHREPGG